jgi:hypothetical protein
MAEGQVTVRQAGRQAEILILVLVQVNVCLGDILPDGAIWASTSSVTVRRHGKWSGIVDWAMVPYDV